MISTAIVDNQGPMGRGISDLSEFPRERKRYVDAKGKKSPFWSVVGAEVDESNLAVLVLGPGYQHPTRK